MIANTLSLLQVANHWKDEQVTVVTDDGTTGEILSTSLFVANQKQRELIMSEFLPKRVIDLELCQMV